MFGLGPTELIIILVIALIIFGPKRLPEMGSAIGKSIREFKKSTRELKDEIDITQDVKEVQADIKESTGIDELKKDVEEVVNFTDDSKDKVAEKS